MTEKWHLLELFSRASFYTGLCYMQAGDIRGAKSMLLHCLIFCEAFRMRKRFHLAFKLFSRISHFNLIIILMYYCWLRKPVKVIKLNQEIDKKSEGMVRKMYHYYTGLWKILWFICVALDLLVNVGI